MNEMKKLNKYWVEYYKREILYPNTYKYRKAIENTYYWQRYLLKRSIIKLGRTILKVILEITMNITKILCLIGIHNYLLSIKSVSRREDKEEEITELYFCQRCGKLKEKN